MNYPDPVIKMWSRKLEVTIQFQTHFRINAIICSYLGYLFISKHCRSQKKWRYLHDRLCTVKIINICCIISVIVHFIWHGLILAFFCGWPCFFQFYEWSDCLNQVFWMLQYFNEKLRIEAEMHHVVNVGNKSEVSLAQH